MLLPIVGWRSHPAIIARSRPGGTAAAAPYLAMGA
jgi:hypothetical protein